MATTVEQIKEKLGIADLVSSYIRLEKAGVNMKSRIKIERNRHFDGKTFVVTGELEKFSRDEVVQKITSLGGKVSSSVSSKTDFVLAGKDPGSKLDKARSLGVAVVSEKEVIKWMES